MSQSKSDTTAERGALLRRFSWSQPALSTRAGPDHTLRYSSKWLNETPVDDPPNIPGSVLGADRAHSVRGAASHQRRRCSDRPGAGHARGREPQLVGCDGLHHSRRRTDSNRASYRGTECRDRDTARTSGTDAPGTAGST